MQKIELRTVNRSAGNPGALVAIIVTWIVVLVATLTYMIIENDATNPFRDFYMLPWIALSGFVVMAPTFYLFYKGKFDIFHPLVFAAWAYNIPCLVFAGLILSAGWSYPYFYSFIQNPETDLPLTLVYVALGFAGLTVGFVLPIGRIFGEKLERALPKWEWTLRHTWIAGYLLVVAGTLVNIMGFIDGLLGYQRFDTVETYDGMIFFLLIMFFQGYFLLWYALFKTPNKDSSYLVTLCLLVALVPLRMAIMGNRGSFYVCVLPIVFAYIVAGKKITMKHGIVFSLVIGISIFVGVIYGTAFRNIKGLDAMSSSDYISQVGATLDYIAEKDTTLILYDGWSALSDRLENLSSLAVVVSNYEKLAPYEESYGLANNIVRDAWTSLIPRAFWNDKPPTSDPHAYSDLYFEFADNSFAITPYGDLLRNFGPWGVPLGMLLVGIYLRAIHVGFTNERDGWQWRSACYYLLLTIVSYEAFYATLLPSILRVALVLAVTMYLANLIAQKTGGKWNFNKTV